MYLLLFFLEGEGDLRLMMHKKEPNIRIIDAQKIKCLYIFKKGAGGMW